MPTTADRRGWAGIPADERRATRRTRLLDAALELLGTDGWSATTVRGICLTAKLNPRYFYESFASLDALLVAVYDRTVEELAATVYRAAEGAATDPESQVRAVLRGIVDFVDEDQRRGRVLYVEAIGNEALNLRRIETGHELVELLERDASERYGRPPAGERIGRIAAAFLVGGFGELLGAWLAGRIDVSKSQLVDDASTLFLAVGDAAGRIAHSRGNGDRIPGAPSSRTTDRRAR
ncbi:MAG: TetR/AcrR family transcriptional regulator [Acidimicrobiia bacterium]|nr:TetR/AcrR family transcriptional regulator [Acidimicrobiia bacterium]